MIPDQRPWTRRTGPISVELVSHAALLIRAGGIGLLTDPWLAGTVFGGGWRLLRERGGDDLPWSEVTHLWLSHGHPDHLHPPSLSQIPARELGRITVLRSDRPGRDGIDKALRSAGFASFENFRAGSWHPLGGQLEVFEGLFDIADRDDQGDTFLAVRAGDASVLNLNDCVVRRGWQGREILRRTGLDRVDLLCTQFSYGQWAGNAQDTALRKAKAERKLDRLVLQAESLRSRAVLPFASFFVFCHQENRHLNDEVVTPDRVVSRLRSRSGAEPVVLFPGERWTVGSAWDSEKSCAAWTRAYDTAKRATQWVDDDPTAGEAVGAAIERWNSTFAHSVFPTDRLVLRACRVMPKITVRITDVRLAFEVTPGRQVRQVSATRTCDVAMTSAAAVRCFASLRGPEEIRFGGRLMSDTGRVDRFLRLATTASLIAGASRPLFRAEAARMGRRTVARLLTARPVRPPRRNPAER